MYNIIAIIGIIMKIIIYIICTYMENRASLYSYVLSYESNQNSKLSFIEIVFVNIFLVYILYTGYLYDSK